MNPTKLIAIYARVSTARQEEEQTVKTQLLTLHEFAQKNGHTIVQEYIDEGWSGDILARPSLDKLRQDAKDKVWEAVLIYDPDRLARRYSYQELIMDELKEAGIEIIFVTISAPKNSEDKILHGVRGLFAEYERTKIAERFRLGKLRKVKEGNILTTEPLYGYDYIPKKEKQHGYYLINEAEARVVRMIYSWVAGEELSLRKIVRRLQELGIKPRRSKRGVWNTSTLTTMLRHKGYIGEAHWGKSYAVVPLNPIKQEKYRKTKKTSRRERPEEEWYKIAIPPIIDKDLFNRVRVQLAKNFELSPRNRKNQYLLAGRIFCICGRRRAGEGPQKGKYQYYRCNARIYCFPLPLDCKESGINSRIADHLVWERISTLMSSPELMEQQAIRFLNNQKERIEHSEIDEKEVQKEIAKIKEQEDRYNKAYGAGVFSVEQLSAYLTPLREQAISLGKQVTNNREVKARQNAMMVPDPLLIQTFAEKSLSSLGDLSFEAKRAIVTTVIEKVVATKKQLSVYGFIPVEKNVAFFPIHRDGLSVTDKNLEYRNGIPFSFEIKMPDYYKFYQIKNIILPKDKKE